MDYRVFVVGQKNFQNQLLKEYLDVKLKKDCILFSDPNVCPKVESTGVFSLVLWDCLENKLLPIMEQLESLKKNCEDLYFALFNFSEDFDIQRDVLEKGVRGVFFKSDPPELIVKGINAIAVGELWFPRGLMARFLLEAPPAPAAKEGGYSEKFVLSSRESEILGHIAAGLSNNDIAKELCISIHTVKTHVYNIFKKINVPNRLQAALWAARNL